MTAATLEDDLLREQVRLVYRQAGTGSRGNMVTAFVCAALVWSAGLPLTALVPFGLVWVVYSVRLLHVAQLGRAEDRRPMSAWRALSVRSSAAAGVSWGLIGALTFPRAPSELQVFLLVISVGLTAAGLATLAPLRSSYLAYLVPFVGSMALSTASFFPRYPFPLAGLLVFFVAVMWRASGEQSTTVARSLRLALENQALVGELIEAQRRAEEERGRAVTANQAKSQFLARMSHEIRTPMNGVLGVHELLLSSPLDPEARSLIETAHQSGRALLSIINDVLDFSKIEAGKVTLETAPFGLEPMVEEVVSLFAIATERKGLTLTYEFDDELASRVVGDELRLRQVLTNLLGNALKFTDRGTISLVVRKAAGGVTFAVKDSGPGVSPADKQRIFESFEQLDGSISRRFGGTGLGLSISLQLVALMGGALELRSTVGEGSEFFFTLPLPADPSATARPPLQGPGLSAVVAVTEPAARARLGRWLTGGGFEVVQASGADAWGAGVPGLVVVDEAQELALTRARAAGVPRLVFAQRTGLHASAQTDPKEAWLSFPLRHSAFQRCVDQVLERVVRPVATPSPAAWAGARVLVVDDDGVNRIIAEAMLGRLGCHAEVLDGGQVALAAMARERFDLVLMDCEMPDLDGLSVTRELRRRERLQHNQRVPVVALTAHATEAQRALCLAAEMDEMVVKPLSLATLESCLRRWLVRG